MESYEPRMKVINVLSTTQNPQKQEIFRGNVLSLKEIPLAVEPCHVNPIYFYLVRQARFLDGAVEVSEAVYDLTDLRTEERHPLKYYGDRKQVFSINGETSLDSFLDRDLSGF